MLSASPLEGTPAMGSPVIIVGSDLGKGVDGWRVSVDDNGGGDEDCRRCANDHRYLNSG